MPTPNTPVTVSELRMRPVGDQVWGKYIIMSLQKRRTKDGKAICNLRLGDRKRHLGRHAGFRGL